MTSPINHRLPDDMTELLGSMLQPEEIANYTSCSHYLNEKSESLFTGYYRQYFRQLGTSTSSQEDEQKVETRPLKRQRVAKQIKRPAKSYRALFYKKVRTYMRMKILQKGGLPEGESELAISYLIQLYRNVDRDLLRDGRIKRDVKGNNALHHVMRNPYASLVIQHLESNDIFKNYPQILFEAKNCLGQTPLHILLGAASKEKVKKEVEESTLALINRLFRKYTRQLIGGLIKADRLGLVPSQYAYLQGYASLLKGMDARTLLGVMTIPAKDVIKVMGQWNLNRGVKSKVSAPESKEPAKNENAICQELFELYKAEKSLEIAQSLLFSIRNFQNSAYFLVYSRAFKTFCEKVKESVEWFAEIVEEELLDGQTLFEEALESGNPLAASWLQEQDCMLFFEESDEEDEDGELGIDE